MHTPIIIPQLGLVEAVVLLEWLTPDGGQVEKGTPILLVETEKAQTEIVAPGTGTLFVTMPAGDQEVSTGAEVGHIESL